MGVYGLPSQPAAAAMARSAMAAGWRVQYRRASVYGPGQIERQFDAIVVFGRSAQAEAIARDYSRLDRPRPVLVVGPSPDPARPGGLAVSLVDAHETPPVPMEGRDPDPAASTQFSLEELATGEPIPYLLAWAAGELGEANAPTFDPLEALEASLADADLAEGVDVMPTAPESPACATADVAALRRELEGLPAVEVKARAQTLRIAYTNKGQAIAAILGWYGAPQGGE